MYMALGLHPYFAENNPYFDTTGEATHVGGIERDQEDTTVMRSVGEVKNTATAECSAILRKCRHNLMRRNTTTGSTGNNSSDATGYRRLLVRWHSEGEGQLPMKKKPICSHKGSYGNGLTPCYPTEALHREIERHDRWLVHSMAWLQSFDGGSIAAYRDDGSSGSKSTGKQRHKPITLIIHTVNRHLPYLAVTVTSILRGHHPSYLRDNVDMHIVNLEQRPCRCAYTFFAELAARLPFAKFHDRSVSYAGHDNNIVDGDIGRLFMTEQRREYIRSLSLCKDNGSEWCFIFEDDAVSTANLIPKFLRLVEEAGRDLRKRLAVISFYYPLNEMWNDNGKQLYKPEYANSDEYKLDSNVSDHIGPETGNIVYSLIPNETPHGLVANAYPSEVLDRLISYLEADERINNTTYATDRMIMKGFSEEYNMEKLRVEPSPVGHIGHYSENRRESGRGIFFWVSTNVKFRIEDGWDAYGDSLGGDGLSENPGFIFK